MANINRSDINFNWDAHVIKYNDTPFRSSITKGVSYLHEEFDSEKMAFVMEQKYFNDETSKYFHMHAKDILNEWDMKAKTSRRYGSAMDDYIGLVLNGTPSFIEDFLKDRNLVNDERFEGTVRGFIEFIADMKAKHNDICFVDREKSVYYKVNDKFALNGRFDALFYVPSTKTFVLVDWKCAKDLASEMKNNKYKRLFGPLADHYDNSANIYTVQTILYRRILESYIKSDFENPEQYTIVNMIVNLGKPSASGKRNYQIFHDIIKYDEALADSIMEYIATTVENNK